MKGPWKCPSCSYISTRNWNIKSHINRKHSGYGVPLHLLRTKTAIISNSQDLIHDTDERVENLHLTPESIFKSIIDQKDEREVSLYNILEQISPQFREIEQLLVSANCDYKTMQFILTSTVISALSSNNPIESINDSLKTCYLFSTSAKMINYAAYVFNTTPALAKEILKRFLQTSNV
jgi:hypothetical protein